MSGEGRRQADAQATRGSRNRKPFFSCCYPGTVSEDVGELLRDAKRKGSAEGVGAMPASL